MLKADNLELTTDITCRYKYAKCFKFFRHSVRDQKRCRRIQEQKHIYDTDVIFFVQCATHWHKWYTYK